MHVAVEEHVPTKQEIRGSDAGRSHSEKLAVWSHTTFWSHTTSRRSVLIPSLVTRRHAAILFHLLPVAGRWCLLTAQNLRILNIRFYFARYLNNRNLIQTLEMENVRRNWKYQNKNRFHTIFIMPQSDDFQTHWRICIKFWYRANTGHPTLVHFHLAPSIRIK
jgi:hypothetical protein